MEMSEEKIKIKGENGGLSLAFPAAMGTTWTRELGSFCAARSFVVRVIASRRENSPMCRSSFGRTG